VNSLRKAEIAISVLCGKCECDYGTKLLSSATKHYNIIMDVKINCCHFLY